MTELQARNEANNCKLQTLTLKMNHDYNHSHFRFEYNCLTTTTTKKNPNKYFIKPNMRQIVTASTTTPIENT